MLLAPSLPLILYGVIAQQLGVGGEVSIDDLFLAGILPCLLMVIMLSGWSFWVNRSQTLIEFSAREALAALRETCEKPSGLALLQGPPLSGKTTLLQHFAGQLEEDRVYAIVDGTDLSTMGLLEAALRQFPLLNPFAPNHPTREIYAKTWDSLSRFEKPLLTVFCDDPGAEGAEKPFQDRVPGAKGQPHVMLDGPGHFACDEIPDEFSAMLLEFIRTTADETA